MTLAIDAILDDHKTDISNACKLLQLQLVKRHPMAPNLPRFCHLFDSWKILLPIDFYESFGFDIKNLCFHCTKTLLLDLAGKTAAIIELLLPSN